MTGGRQGKGKEVAGVSRNSEFVPPAIHQTFGSSGTHSHGNVALPSPTSQIPSSRGSGVMESSHVPDSPASSGTGADHVFIDNGQKIFIRPRTNKKFDKQLHCIHKIGELIEMRFEGAWKSWSKFPQEIRDLIFSEFGKYYEWDPMQARQIRSIFDSCAMNCIKNRMYQIRQRMKKPEWLGQQIFEDLNQIFVQDDFKTESQRNKKNRASDCDGQGFPLHVGGCVSHSEHIDRMTAKQGHEPSIADAFMNLRSKVDSDGNLKWVNERAKRTHEEYMTKLTQISSQNSNESDGLSTQEQIKIFSEVVGGPKKGVIYGLAGQNYTVMHGQTSSSRLSSPMEWESERTQLLSRMNEMQSSINDLQVSFETRVETAVVERIATMEARMEERMEARMEERMEARLMAKIQRSFENNMRGLSVNPDVSKSPPTHQ